MRREVGARVRSEAARLCADAITTRNLDATLIDKLAELVSDNTVERLLGEWDGALCKELAEVAQTMLSARGYLNRLLQYVINHLMRFLGYGDFSRAFACELVTAIPVPLIAKITAAARVIQVTGICLCFINERSLADCECMIDIIKFESKEMLNMLLLVELSNWREMVVEVAENGASQHGR